MHHPRGLSGRRALALAAGLISAGVLASGCTGHTPSGGQSISRITAPAPQPEKPLLAKPVYRQACTDGHHACATFPTDGDPADIDFLEKGVGGMHVAGLLVSGDGHKICPTWDAVSPPPSCRAFQSEDYRLAVVPYPGLTATQAFERWFDEHDPNASGRPVPGNYRGHESLDLKREYPDSTHYLRLVWSSGRLYAMSMGSSEIGGDNPKVVPPHFKFLETLVLS
ncbi:MAG TPA: hypothetical protein VMT30_04165 [Candidatus Saccharimonadia bacterium]|nr:hypothetical protein [Candidatus Saccharimonadia bacterium]